MENATKALIIAAAILIAIVLISIGVFVLRQGQDAMTSVNMSEAQIMAFNSKFETYAGTQRGSQVNALIDRVISSNREQLAAGADESTLVSVKLGNNDIITKQSPTPSLQANQKASTAGYYTVQISNGPKTGLVETITITEVNN